ncbi:hypothetical protein JD844_031636 [Phrynosoma platyrhinos]|uniref:Uncharacterized protein n=1 Tax=Phrynosoma platyrhinos TaxID=52577 RepID=A0ABQ7T157_PHRPL|nr:hypothetical protein JD844_031636 [Phrynosoma platyrhinos]
MPPETWKGLPLRSAPVNSATAGQAMETANPWPSVFLSFSRHKHHRGCLKKPALAQPKSRRGWLSHYKATYTCLPAVRPRSSKRPPCTPPHPNPPPMDLQTTQRTAFMAWDPERQLQTQIKGRHHQLPWEPSRRQAPHGHCHAWPPASPPGKLPPRLVKHTSPSNQCSLGCRKEQPNLSENDPKEHPPAPVFGERQEGIAKSLQPMPAGYVTKYQSDFPPRRSFPGKAAPALPPLDNLAINRTFSTSFETVQKESFRRWDSAAYSRAKERLGRESGGDPGTKVFLLIALLSRSKCPPAERVAFPMQEASLLTCTEHKVMGHPHYVPASASQRPIPLPPSKNT